MNLRIGYCTGQYPRATDTFIQREVAALRAGGVHVDTFSVRRPSDSEMVGPEQRQERERTFYILPPSIVGLLAAHLGFMFRSPGRYLSAMGLAWKTRAPGLKALVWQLFYFAEAAVLAREVNRRNLTHVHNHFVDSSCSVTMLAAAMGGFTYSVTVHGPWIWFEPMRWRVDEKFGRALFVSCISHFCRSQAMIFTPAQKWNRLHVVHCGVDPGRYERVEHVQGGATLTYTGRLATVKGLPVLLEAMVAIRRAHPGVELMIVGDGPDRAMLERMAADLEVSGNVRFAGYQSQAAVAEQLGRTDVFVMTSFAEGVPVSLMEAMAAGVPVVAPRIAGIAELVDDGESGYLTPPGDAATVAERIIRLLDDAGMRRRFGEAGRRKVEAEFNLAHEAQWLRRILTSALDGRVETLRPTEEPTHGNEIGHDTGAASIRN